MSEEQFPMVNARISFQDRIIVSDCPFCREKHYHNLPVGKNGRKTSECLRGEYFLNFSPKDQETVVKFNSQ
jgi:hypothetical protein